MQDAATCGVLSGKTPRFLPDEALPVAHPEEAQDAIQEPTERAAVTDKVRRGLDRRNHHLMKFRRNCWAISRTTEVALSFSGNCHSIEMSYAFQVGYGITRTTMIGKPFLMVLCAAEPPFWLPPMGCFPPYDGGR